MAKIDGERVKGRAENELEAILDNRYSQEDSHSKIITGNKTLIIQQQRRECDCW